MRCLNAIPQLGRCVGSRIKSQTNGLSLLTHSKYNKALLARAKMSYANGDPTPKISNFKLSKHGSQPFSNLQLYKLMVGALQFVTLTSQDIAFSVNKTCQSMSSPLDTHWATGRRILMYLSGSISHDIIFSPSTSPHKFSSRTYSDRIRKVIQMIASQP